MRWTCLPLLATLAACATQGEGPYDVYAPSAPVDIQSMSTMEPVMATANAAPWVNEHGKTFLGFTAPQTGRWTWPGAEVGLDAGDAACKAQGADHACTLAEIVIAQEAGELARAAGARRLVLSHLLPGASAEAAASEAAAAYGAPVDVATPHLTFDV